jgi:CDP-6-deoxy-D-xylo-4-hexulose-3-dehydrase
MSREREQAAANLRQEILSKVAEYYRLKHADRPFVPGESLVHYAGRVFDERELINGVEAVLEFQLTHGHFGREFEQKLGAFLGAREIVPVNSGSSANLVAMTTLCAQQLRNHLQPGDEVITPAATFPTTLAPIIQNQLVPVLVDCQLGTYNIDVDQLEGAYSDKVRAVFVPHTLGNPVEMDKVVDFARRHNLFVVEDTCDALGSRYDGRMCGTFGHLATLSFYPAHHMTTGEGGVVFTNSRRLGRLARVVRDWGRDCFCGYDNPLDGKCGRRFEWKIGDDEVYDHRYYFTEIGYNLKMTDLQAAIGVAQIDKVPSFIEKRKRHFRRLYEHLRQYEDALLLPTWSPKADPAWFAFPITVRPGAGFDRRQMTRFLEQQRIETRFLFAGNILQQPGYRHIQCRVAGDLPNAGVVLRRTFFVGVYPGLDEGQLGYMLETFDKFFESIKRDV